LAVFSEFESVKRAVARTPQQSWRGIEAPPHKNLKRLADSVPKPDFMHFIPLAELWSIAIK
jgi:hypothetical protein